MNQRVKELRKALHLSQSQFGKKLCVTGPAISRIEKGDRAVTDQMAKAICNEFNVNPDWLYNGTGEMLREFPSPLMEQLAQEFKLDELEQEFIQDFLTLDATERQIIARFLRGSK
ncbi:helix-turn-helix domain-containing protein [Massilioclostridium coli]|uniref:helix-turn-helix domain-containing protein n=1 Tax=Massilioclostridium coli TaxID=1870991 RepID=UPI00085CCD2A|nr:helix-turn-helix transcriptional regulator [Massilioclostridium coli]